MPETFRFQSEGLQLSSHLEIPDSEEKVLPGVLLVHGFPEGPGGGANSASTIELKNHPRVGQVWLVGFGSGGAISICAAAKTSEVQGVGALAAPADWSAWAASPKRLLIHARRAGVIPDPNFPDDFDSWSADLKLISAESDISRLSGMSILIVHGTEDDVVSSLEARALSDAHGNTDMRLIEGAGHHLRHDPRAIAILLGWLDKQRRVNK